MCLEWAAQEAYRLLGQPLEAAGEDHFSRTRVGSELGENTLASGEDCQDFLFTGQLYFVCRIYQLHHGQKGGASSPVNKAIASVRPLLLFTSVVHSSPTKMMTLSGTLCLNSRR